VLRKEESGKNIGLHTPNGEHVKPRSLLEYANEADYTDDTERGNRKFLGQFVHAVLEWRSLFFHLSARWIRD
jgi:hypothetical protein